MISRSSVEHVEVRGFPHRIFCPCALWTMGPPGSQSCWDVTVSQKVDILARELHLEFSGWIRTHMGALRTLRPGFYTVFRCVSGYWLGLGSNFQKNQTMPYLQKSRGHILWNMFQTLFRLKMFARGPNLIFRRVRFVPGIQLEPSQEEINFNSWSSNFDTFKKKIVPGGPIWNLFRQKSVPGGPIVTFSGKVGS